MTRHLHLQALCELKGHHVALWTLMPYKFEDYEKGNRIMLRTVMVKICGCGKTIFTESLRSVGDPETPVWVKS